MIAWLVDNWALILGIATTAVALALIVRALNGAGICCPGLHCPGCGHR